jgi:hypothetical protein
MGLLRIFRRKHSVPNVNFYQYTQGPVYTNGAEEFIFQQKWEWPVQTLEGAGKRAGSFNIYQPQQLRAQLALTAASLQGAGVVASTYEKQRLWMQGTVGSVESDENGNIIG